MRGVGRGGARWAKAWPPMMKDSRLTMVQMKSANRIGKKEYDAVDALRGVESGPESDLENDWFLGDLPMAVVLG